MAEAPDNQKVLEPLTQAEERRVHTPIDPWDDTFAAKIVKQDFEGAENYRTQNHDWRWRAADEAYLAWVAQKYWPGTRVPRSSLGVFVALEQVESLLPKLLSSIFADNPWFDAEPRPGTSPAESRAVRELVLAQMDDTNIRETVRRALKSGLIYGNGLVEVCQEYYEEELPHFVQTFEPVKRDFNLGPLGVVPVVVDVKRVVKETKVKNVINRPLVRYLSLKDFYIDSNCPGPVAQEARFAIKRVPATVDELDALREQPGFKIPDRLVLHALAQLKPATQGDVTKASGEQMRQGFWSPAEDTSADPGSKRIEVLQYWTKRRLVWLANRSHVLYNIPNPYGFIPFFNAFYIDVLDRFYSLAVTDIVEGEQHLIQSILNGRVDELALALHPTRIKRRGLSIPAYQLRRRPGQLIEAENPREDVVTEEVQNVTAQAFLEVDAADRRVQKATGVTDLAMMGTPATQGNAAARTATGVNVQAQASFSRAQYLVENNENTFIEPILEAVHTLNVRFLDPNQVQEIMGSEGEAIRIDPLSVKNARVKFAMRASARMQSRLSLLQTFPLLAQVLLNPEFMQLLAQQQGKVVDVEELSTMLLDATGYRKRHGIFRKLQPQEQAGLRQPPPEELVRVQMQRERLAGQREEGEASRENELIKEAMAGAFKMSSEAGRRTNGGKE